MGAAAGHSSENSSESSSTGEAGAVELGREGVQPVEIFPYTNFLGLNVASPHVGILPINDLVPLSRVDLGLDMCVFLCQSSYCKVMLYLSALHYSHSPPPLWRISVT